MKRSRKVGYNEYIGLNVPEICKQADIVYMGLHGDCGENGELQAFFDAQGIRYTGSGAQGCRNAMDKWLAKKLFQQHGILTPEGGCLLRGEPYELDALPIPCVVKPCNGGSSIGVALPDTREELERALYELEPFHSRVIVEEKIFGRELTQPILDNDYLSAIEIVPPEGSSFDYVAKYQSGAEGAQELCPAPITAEEQRIVGEAALKFHRALGLSVYSRSDFILDKDGRAWCLEVNTLPGMTPNSLIPKAARVAGMSYEELCEKIVTLSLAERGK